MSVWKKELHLDISVFIKVCTCVPGTHSRETAPGCQMAQISTVMSFQPHHPDTSAAPCMVLSDKKCMA